jgi:hypothetical protein
LSDDTDDSPDSNPERTMFDTELLARIQAQEAAEQELALDDVTGPEPVAASLEHEVSASEDPEHAFDERPTEDGFGDADELATSANAGGDAEAATVEHTAANPEIDEEPDLTLAEQSAVDEPTSAGTFPSRPAPEPPEGSEDLWAEGTDNVDLSGRLPTADEASRAEATAAIDLKGLEDTGNLEPEVGAQVRAELGEENTDQESPAEDSIRLIPHHPQHPEIEVGHRALTLGRSSGIDITIADNTLSRRHCSLWFRGGELWVEDLNSGNGTFVNGDRVTDPRLLVEGDELLVGQTIRFAVPEFRRSEPAPVNEEAQSPQTLMGSEGGYSTTFAHTGSLLVRNRIRRLLPFVASALILLMGIVVFAVRHNRANAQQVQLNQASDAFFAGIDAYKVADLDGATKAFKTAQEIDPKHPRLPLYLAQTAALRTTAQALDGVEKHLANGALDDAAATLYSATPTANTKNRINTLEGKLQKARLDKDIKRFGEHVTHKNYNLALALLQTMRNGALSERPEEIARLAGQLPPGMKVKGRSPTPSSTQKTQKRNRRSSIEGPLKRMHIALRQGRIEQAFKINRDLAASGVRAASRLEGSGNLAELRERHRMAESAVAERNWRQALAATDRALKLVRKISPSARGTLRKLKHLRAEAWLAKATELGNNSKLCEARKALDNARKNNSSNQKVKNGFSRLRNFAKTKLDFAKKRLAEGASKGGMTPHLKLALCLAKRGGPVWKETRKLLR